jgi:hypothetical protein
MKERDHGGSGGGKTRLYTLKMQTSNLKQKMDAVPGTDSSKKKNTSSGISES